MKEQLKNLKQTRKQKRKRIGFLFSNSRKLFLIKSAIYLFNLPKTHHYAKGPPGRSRSPG